MSVYHEAVLSGRLDPATVAVRGARRALKDVKRAEAEERNARTPLKRTAHWRRDRAQRAARYEQIGGDDRG